MRYARPATAATHRRWAQPKQRLAPPGRMTRTSRPSCDAFYAIVASGLATPNSWRQGSADFVSSSPNTAARATGPDVSASDGLARPGYAPRWTPERVGSELEAFLADREVWPSRREFEAAGLNLLREAVNRLGGVEVWAAKFGLPRPNNSAGSTRIWDERRLERAVGPLVRRLGRWPTKREFHEAGLASAQSAMYRYGGVERWRKRFGVASAPRHGRVPTRRVWSDERIESELRAYCAGRTEWPGQREFIRDGKGGLYKAASLHGGIGGWQKRLGLRPPRRTYPAAEGARERREREALQAGSSLG